MYNGQYMRSAKNMKLKRVTNNPAQTKKFAEILARQILKNGPQKEAFVIGLIGDLGGGKTTFLQGFAKGLGIRDRVLSPTFVIFKRFKIQNSKFKNFYHFDCYRIKDPKEVLTLGFVDIIKNPEAIVSVEWADRIWKILPKDSMIVEFEFLNEKKRTIEIVMYPGVDN